ncbi:MAG TPA: hypothetical protein VGU02_15120 [Gaiellaceae bacterium]|nr:hypothetical protein [Gaiellaceae bacterium]
MRKVVFAAAVAVAVVLAQSASASQLIDRNAHGITLAVNAKGEALMSYTSGGKVKHVLAWGAVNAIAPTTVRPQVAFKLDYAGGWGKYHADYWKTFGRSCAPYDGPALAWFVAACKAPDGSYWALQSWQRELPDYGVAATPTQSVRELRLSHWTGDLPVLDITLDWAYRQFDQLFGTYTYDGLPVFGFHSTSTGNPLDTFGRNIYVDTYDSAYGTGWRRDNSFLTHTGKGSFCYGFYPHGAHPTGKGVKYRASAEGPGVTPDVMWQGTAPGAYDRDLDLQANDALRALGDAQCKPN